MSLMRNLVVPLCRRLHQGALTALIPRSRYSTSAETQEPEAKLREFFDAYDTDKSGEISKDELYEIIEKCIGGKHTSSMFIVDKILADCDKDGDQTITFDEFRDGMKSYMAFLTY